MCGEVLVGAHGIKKISRSYLEFQGFMRDWVADPHSGWREQTFISPPDKRLMAFCTEEDATCLIDYIKMRRDSERVRREQALRDGATKEWEQRGSTGYRGAPPPSSPPRH